jgi:hypothetical protein
MHLFLAVMGTSNKDVRGRMILLAQRICFRARIELAVELCVGTSLGDLKPTRRQAPLGGDGDDCLLVDHRARTLENPISRPLNKMRSVRLRCGLPPVTQSRDVLKESRPRIEKAWTTD